MTADTTDRVLQAARRLFGERGYAGVTIRAIAQEAGVSPALVMKIAGSKDALFEMAAPREPEPLAPGVAIEGLGELLVRRMVDRRDEEQAEPWLRALTMLPTAPDPAAARQDFRERFLRRFPDTGPGRRQADEVACLLLGLAAGMRSFRLLESGSTDTEALIREYGAFVQAALDRMGPALPVAEPDGRIDP